MSARWGLDGDAAVGPPPQAPSFRAAARAILSATHVLIAAGAGFSADSGLPIYDEIANEPAWTERGLTYGDLCRPSLLETDPEMAYGFWGACWNLYRDTPPHRGYSILRKWCETKKSWYVYTSNVDGHFRAAGFDRDRVLEMHGSLDRWIRRKSQQGADMSQVELADTHRFQIHESTRLLKKKEKKAGILGGAASGGEAPEKKNERGGEGGEEGAEGQEGDGVPRDSNGDLMRPAVLMFEDEFAPLLALLKVEQDRYQLWEAEVEEELSSNEHCRFVIIELGCGTRVPVVRQETECVLKEASEKASECAGVPVPVLREAAKQKSGTLRIDGRGGGGGDGGEGGGGEGAGGGVVGGGDERVVLVRINPEYPFNPRDPQRTISLQCKALDALEAIDVEMQALRSH